MKKKNKVTPFDIKLYSGTNKMIQKHENLV